LRGFHLPLAGGGMTLTLPGYGTLSRYDSWPGIGPSGAGGLPAEDLG
jgi:hypothetical protein